MICSHPLTRIETYDGKISFTGAYIKDAEASKEWNKKLENAKNIKSVKIIPCGQCISCRLNKASDWANRLMLEAKEYQHNYFITLTYDDEHLPIKRIYNDDTGEIITGHTLKKEDLDKFNNYLRRYWLRNYDHVGIRYYECGEYGELNGRPHYHGIIFNLPYLNDLKLYKITRPEGNTLYTSETLSKIWGKGYVVVGEVTWESADYVARYVMKKQYGKEADEYYKSQAKIPEFTTMSRMPGIGYNYYDKNKEVIYKTDEIFIKKEDGVIATKPSKYFDRLLEQEDPKKYKEIKRRRENKNKHITEIQTQELKSVENIQHQREVKERNLQNRIKALKRDL